MSEQRILGEVDPRDPNAELIQKTIDKASLLNGGLLNNVQQDRFVVFVKRFSVMLDQVRFIRMPQSQMEVDALHVGEPISVSASEDTTASVFQSPQFRKITLTASKLRSDWNITTEVLQDNIEQEQFEETVMQAFGERMATDMEDLAWNGDTTLTGTDPDDSLRKTIDGWLKRTDSAHILDAGGNAINKEIWHEAKRALPKQFRNDRDLRWYVSPTIADDWLNVLAERQTVLGDRALAGEGVDPAGIPIQRVPVLPDDLSLTVSAATPAQVLGERHGPFTFSATASTIDISVNGGPDRTVTFAEDTLLLVEVLKEINDVLDANNEEAVAVDNGEGQVLLATTTKGSDKSIEVTGGGDANDVLGFAAGGTGVISGSNSGTDGTVLEGSSIVLANPKNLLWGILDGTRIFSEFNRLTDRIETTAYNQVATQVENLDAVVKITNVRRSSNITAV